MSFTNEEIYGIASIEIALIDARREITELKEQLEQKDKEIERQKEIVARQFNRNYDEVEKLKARNEKLERVVEIATAMRNLEGTAINSMPMLESEFDEALNQLNEVDDES